jgi:GTP-binding protein
VAVAPPTLVIFCNHPRLFDAPYRRYLLNVCRDQLPFAEVPIKLHLRQRDSHVPISREPAESDESPDVGPDVQDIDRQPAAHGDPDDE